jgi:hypothetical protein
VKIVVKVAAGDIVEVAAFVEEVKRVVGKVLVAMTKVGLGGYGCIAAMGGIAIKLQDGRREF